MTQGSNHSQEVKDKFRAEYLTTLNASGSARKVGIPESTGRDLAAKIRDEPGFSEIRRKLREEQLETLVQYRMEIAAVAKDRAVAEKADEYQTGEGVQVIDKRTDWAKVALDSEKNAHNLAKVESVDTGGSDKPTKVILEVTGPDGSGA